jgi:hypothetical protein
MGGQHRQLGQPSRAHAGDRRRLAKRGAMRGVTAVEGAVTFAVVGALLAVAVPAFVRELHASRFVEPVEGVEKIAAHAVAYAHDRPIASAFPASAPLTPSQAPHGTREVDPPGAWDHPSWKALDFRPVPEGVPHAFAFAFDSVAAPSAPAGAPSSGSPDASGVVNGARSTFAAHAHGDLDGDGITSTFEVRGHAAEGEPGAVVDPGMLVEAEVE